MFILHPFSNNRPQFLDKAIIEELFYLFLIIVLKYVSEYFDIIFSKSLKKRLACRHILPPLLAALYRGLSGVKHRNHLPNIFIRKLFTPVEKCHIQEFSHICIYFIVCPMVMSAFTSIGNNLIEWVETPPDASQEWFECLINLYFSRISLFLFSRF